MVNYLDETGLGNVWSKISSIFTRKSDLATVATSGDYKDLKNAPNIPEGVTVDTTLSATSPNAIQNKAVYAGLQGKANSSHKHSAADITSGTLGSARLPIATKSTAGAIKVGTNLSIANGVLSATVEEIPDDDINTMLKPYDPPEEPTPA